METLLIVNTPTQCLTTYFKLLFTYRQYQSILWKDSLSPPSIITKIHKKRKSQDHAYMITDGDPTLANFTCAIRLLAIQLLFTITQTFKALLKTTKTVTTEYRI